MIGRIDTLVGSGSDYKPFLHYAGIPVMDLRYGSFVSRLDFMTVLGYLSLKP